MKIVKQIQIQPENPEQVIKMVRQFNEVCNYLSGIAFDEKLWHWLPLQRRVYQEVREKYRFTAAQTLVAIRKVAYAYKDKTRRGTKAEFAALGSISLFRHVYYPDGTTVMLYGLRVPYIPREGVNLPRKPKEGTLSYRDGKFFIHQVVEVDCPEPYEVQEYLGCDLGVCNILVDSQSEVYSSGVLNGLRKRHAKLRGRLQSIGTRSAIRLLKLRRRKEGRFARNINHCISKQVVAKAKRQLLGIALEDLKGIIDNIRVRKAQRRQHHSWSFNQLRQFITYKAELAGVPLKLVDPRNTSRTCPECGKVDKRNRQSQERFQCISCGFVGLADIVAAVNIGRRAVSNQPDAPPVMVMCEST